MKVLQKFAEGGTVTSPGNGGTVTYNPIDILNGGKGSDNKNRVYQRGYESLVMLDDSWMINSPWVRDMIKNSDTRIFGKSDGLNVEAVLMRTNEDGQQEITSIIVKTSGGGGQSETNHLEIVNPHTNNNTAAIYAYNLKSGRGDRGEGFSHRASQSNMIRENRIFSIWHQTMEGYPVKNLWSKIQKEYDMDTRDYFNSSDMKNNWTVQRISSTNSLMPSTNENRNIISERPVTTLDDLKTKHFTSEKKYIFDKEGNIKEDESGNSMFSSITYGFDPKYKRRLAGLYGYDSNNPEHYNRVIQNYLDAIIKYKGEKGNLENAYNAETGQWDSQVLKNAGIHINKAGGETYLSIQTESKDQSLGKHYDVWPGYLTINIKIDDKDPMSSQLLNSIETSLISTSPVMADAMAEVYEKGGDNFSSEGNGVQFNFDAISPITGEKITINETIADFQTKFEADSRALELNSIPLEDRTSKSGKYAWVAEVVNGEKVDSKYSSGTKDNVFTVTDYTTSSHPSNYGFRPTATDFLDQDVIRNTKKLEKHITVKPQEIKKNVVVPGGQIVNNQNFPIIREVASTEKSSNTGIINKDDVVEKITTKETGGDYTIQKGDTLTKIAEKNNTTVEELMNRNPQIEDKNKIYAGETMNIPVAGEVPGSGMAPEISLTGEGVPKFYEQSTKNPFGGIPSGTEQDYKKIYLNDTLHDWDESSKQWIPQEVKKKIIQDPSSKFVASSLTKDVEQENIVKELVPTGADTSTEGEGPEVVEKETKPVAYQKGAGSYVDEEGEMIPQSQLGQYEVQEMKKGGMVLPRFIGGGLLEQMTDPNRPQMFTAGWLPKEKEKTKTEKKTEKKTETKTDTKKKPKMTLKEWNIERKKKKRARIESRARKQRHKTHLKETGEWKDLTAAEKKAALIAAKTNVGGAYKYKEGSKWKNPNE